MHTKTKLPIRIIAVMFFIGLAPPSTVFSAPITIHSDDVRPLMQDFVITAYYSPLPNQCCYVKGSFAADVVLNGQGTNGADGTEVYPGMVAAPKSYPFGTRISLPGIGIVTVHDRGGAINVLKSGAHRIDVWMGSGEEGLARALAFGVRRVRGIVYPVGTGQPNESINLAAFSAPLAMLKAYATEESSLLALRPMLNQKGASVQLLQENLRDAGYFEGPISGLFGPQTQKSLENFLKDYEIKEPSDKLTELSAAYLAAAVERKKAPDPFINVTPDSLKSEIAKAQRTLRFLGFYRGRTNGIFDDKLALSIALLQKEEGLVTTGQEPWVGRMGPITRSRAILHWQRSLLTMRARQLMDINRVNDLMVKKGLIVSAFLAEGDTDSDVHLLQNFLIARGYLKTERSTGHFGVETRKAVIAYQIDAKIIEKASDKGAGFVGPATILHLRIDQRDRLYRLVRAEGWEVL